MRDCEPLRGRGVIKNEIDIFDIYNDRITEDMFFKEDVASAVRFYKRYRDAVVGKNKIPKLWNEWYNLHKDNKCWVDWLFDYCFKDVIE